MKVHPSLKELLIDYENEKDHMYNRPSGLDPDDEMFIHHYVSNNSLASVEPEPLAKNKDSESKCLCAKPFIRIDTKPNSCGNCGKVI